MCSFLMKSISISRFLDSTHTKSHDVNFVVFILCFIVLKTLVCIEFLLFTFIDSNNSQSMSTHTRSFFCNKTTFFRIAIIKIIFL